MERKREENRIVSLDYIRFLAITCVILTHVTERVYTLNVEFLCSVGRVIRWSGIALFTVGRLGVPLFMFLTGYLMLDRKYTSQDCLKLWKRKILGMLIATEIWIFIYYIFSLWLNKSMFSFKMLIRQMLFFQGASCPHLWYMGVILGLYIFIPFVANVLNTSNEKVLIYPILLAIMYLFVPPVLNAFILSRGGEPLYKQLDFSFAGGEYGILLIIGWMIKKGYFTCIKNKYYIVLGVIGYALTVMSELYAYKYEISYNVWYNSITLLVASFSIFNLLLKLKKTKIDIFISRLSELSFGVYLIHYIIVILIFKNIQVNNYLLREVIVLFGSVVISFFISWIISLNKNIAKVLF